MDPEKSSSNRRKRGHSLPNIDTVRFVSILWVLFFHIYGSTPGREAITVVETGLEEFVVSIFASGHFGVQLFFVIGGFFIGKRFAMQYLHQSEKISLKHYYWGRLWRIHPPYVVCILIMSILFMVTYKTGWIWSFELITKVDPVPFMVRHNLASLMYLHGILTGYSNPLNNVLWFMETQIQFYLLAPLLALVFRIPLAWVRRIVLLLLVLCWPMLVEAVPGMGHIGIVQHCHWFFLGYLWIDFHLAGYPYLRFSPLLWDILGVASWIAMLSLSPVIIRNCEPLLPIIFLSALISVIKGRFLLQLFNNKWTAMLGTISYTIYLYHYLVVQAFGRLIPSNFGYDNSFGSLIILIICITPIVIIISIPLFLLFEKPFTSPTSQKKNRETIILA